MELPTLNSVVDDNLIDSFQKRSCGGRISPSQARLAYLVIGGKIMARNDEQNLRDIVSGLEAAWNRGDSVAWAEFFADDADFIHILGGYFKGRTTIEQGHRAIFEPSIRAARTSSP